MDGQSSTVSSRMLSRDSVDHGSRLISSLAKSTVCSCGARQTLNEAVEEKQEEASG